MKKPAFILLATFAFLGSALIMQSCSEFAKINRYEIPIYSGPVDVTIPLSTDTATSDNMASGPSYVNIDSVIRAKTNNTLNSSNITAVRHLSTKLILLDGTATNNFANFKSYYVSFYSNSNNYVYTASVPHNPGVTAFFLDFPVDARDELKSYMTGNIFYYSVGGTLRRPVTAPVKCRIETQFNITVND